MKYRFICAVSILTASLSACTIVPTKPVLSDRQQLTADGYVRSQKNSIVVQIKKIDTSRVSTISGNEDFGGLIKYGLPIRVFVGNGGDRPIIFSPDNVKAYKDGKEVNLLTAVRLDEIKQGQQTKNAAWAVFTGTLAMASGIIGATSGSATLAQQTQHQSTQMINSISQQYTANHEFSEKTMSALSEQFGSALLGRTTLQPKNTVDGVVFFEGIDEEDPLTIIVKTGDTVHQFSYQK